MGKRRGRRGDPIELLMQFLGLALLGVLFIPGFKQAIGSLFFLVVIVTCVIVASVIGLKFFKMAPWTDEDEGGYQSQMGSGTGPRDVLTLDRKAGKAEAESSAETREWTLELLKKLEWKRFEDLVAAYVRELGQQARTTRIGPDGGVDVEILDPATREVVMLVQCKAWDAYKVGVKPLRELFGVMAAAKIKEGGFFTTGEFTSEAKEFARENHLDAVDGLELISRIKQLPPESQKRLLECATEGDYTTPSCPSCGVKMISRVAGKGRSEGSSFWGCRNYPRCKRTFRQ